MLIESDEKTFITVADSTEHHSDCKCMHWDKYCAPVSQFRLWYRSYILEIPLYKLLWHSQYIIFAGRGYGRQVLEEKTPFGYRWVPEMAAILQETFHTSFWRSCDDAGKKSGCVDWLSLFTSGPVFCLLLGVSSDYTQPITGQVTEVTCPMIGRAQPCPGISNCYIDDLGY